MVAHIVSAVTHLASSIRLDGLWYVNLCIEAFPNVFARFHHEMLPQYLTMLAGSLKKGTTTMATKIPTLISLHTFLIAISKQLNTHTSFTTALTQSISWESGRKVRHHMRIHIILSHFVQRSITSILSISPQFILRSPSTIRCISSH